MHVVIVGDYPQDPEHVAGGVESVILYLTQALQQYADLKLEVVTLDRWGLGPRVVTTDKVTVHYLPSTGLPGRLSMIANIRQMRDKILDLRPDLIHAQIAGKYAEAAVQTGLPWVLTLHGIRFLEAKLWRGWLNKYRAWTIKREELRAIKQARHLISISPFIQATFGSRLRGEIYNIENPISEAFFKLPAGNQTPGQLLFVGRLIPRKGVHTLLRAFARLHRRMPTATLRLAGGGISRNDPSGYYHDLQRLVDQADLKNSVFFLGELDETAILKEYETCSALVLSSVLETAPMVIMQALAAGKAVVSTDAGGARYLIDNNQTGLIVPSNDDEALANALYHVLSNETALQKMGDRAREVARQRFHAGAVAARTREVYYHILGQVSSQNAVVSAPVSGLQEL